MIKHASMGWAVFVVGLGAASGSPCAGQFAVAGDSLVALLSPPTQGLLPPPIQGLYPVQPPPPLTGLEFLSPRRVATPGRTGSIGLATGETLLANFVPWLIADYVTKWKDITRISPTSWRENIQTGPVWDDNHFHINGLLHPYQGHYYFLAGRSNGYSFQRSFLFTLLGSAFWECCGESHSASTSDLFTTTLGGTVIGETFFRLGSHLLSKNSLFWEWVAGVVTPTRAVTRWVLGQRHPAPGQAIQWELPMELDGHLAAGSAFGQAKGFLEIGVGYNRFDNIRKGDRPFSHFVAVSEWDYQGKRIIGRAHSRGVLWPVVAGQSSNLRYAVVPIQGLDFINRKGYEFGGPSVGLAGALGWKRIVAATDAHVLFAGVQSSFAYLGQYHDELDEKERDREYDFAVGWGARANVSADPWAWLRLSGFAQKDFLNTLHGSNVDGYSSDHDVSLYGFSVLFPKVWGRVGFGVDGRFFRSTSHYANPNPPFVPMERRRVTEWRLYATWDASGKPLSMFAF